ncbi:MAG: chemotaxis-specific protein-glutamate methyltransferase CheB [Cyanobacteriota bacterium ELA615]
MRIAIADNLATVKTLREMIPSEHEIAWIAHNGEQAVSRSLEDRPDLILMGLRISVLDGVQATRLIMLHSPCPIVLVTITSEENTAKIFEAIGYGALDSVNIAADNSQQSLLQKISTVGKLRGIKKGLKKTINAPLVVFGASTGGPQALSIILSHLSANFPSPIVIIQHIDQQFSFGLAQWLDQQTSLKVRTAKEGDRLCAGEALVAATNDHLYLTHNLTLSYTENPVNYAYRPSVDVFFESLAKNWSRPGIAVLLTGMGKDGAQGLKLLRLKGWHTIAQNQTTSAVYGMPKVAVELNAAREILPLEQIATSIKNLVTKGTISK